MKYDALLQKCVWRGDNRRALCSPTLDGERIVASQGHVLVRVPLSKTELSYAPVPDYPKYEHVFEHLERFSDARFLSAGGLSKAIRGIPSIAIMYECPACGGEGWIFTSQGSYLDEGDSEKCPQCKGTGEIPAEPPDTQLDWLGHIVVIGGSLFDPNYIALLRDCCVYAETEEIFHRAGGDSKANLFTVGDIEFILMPIRKQTPESRKLHPVPYEQIRQIPAAFSRLPAGAK